MKPTTDTAIRAKAGKGPETLRQAQRFDTVRNFYARAGLCNRCAAQTAFGHQNGFANVHAPCAACQPIVDTFPVRAGGDWRIYVRHV